MLDLIRHRQGAYKRAEAKLTPVAKPPTVELDEPAAVSGLFLLLLPDRCPHATPELLRLYPPLLLSDAVARRVAPHHRGPVGIPTPALLRRLRRGLS